MGITNKMVRFFRFLTFIIFLIFSVQDSYSQCNTNTSICTPGVAGPFVFGATNPSTFSQGCLNVGAGNHEYGFILLQITQTGPLNLLVNGSSNSGYIDVEVFLIPPGASPCVAIQSSANMIACNYAANAGGCVQFGNAFGCNSGVPAVNVLAGSTLMIVAQDWSNQSNGFTLQLGPPPGAQTGPPSAAFTSPSQICLSTPAITLNAPNGGGTWTGTGVSPTGIFNPATAGVGNHLVTYSIGAMPCFSSTSAIISVVNNITPTFDAQPTICAGSAFTLPTTSTNSPAITGTWSPAVNNTATTTYTFTPTAGQCAVPITRTVTITPSTTPTFAAIGPICSGSTAPTILTTSTNGIVGTWSPSTVNNTATTTYTFTPNPGQCAATASMTIAVTPRTTPTFTAVGPICAGSTLAALPTTSINGIVGTWSPAINNTATTTYTFTPTGGACVNPATMNITVNPRVTPTFTQVAPICSGGTLGALPTTSTNGISGTWSPAVNNTSTTTYTFTPTGGACANPATMSITVNPNVTPTFNPIAAICSGGTFTLPTSSTNSPAITGTWAPPINNTATTTYTFTPTSGLCTSTQTMTVTVNPRITPTFTAVGAICSGSTLDALPTTSNNGITGTWNPAINNTTTTTYTFTPTAGVCANTATMTITVNPRTTPTFTQVAPICSGGTLSALPTTSTNGISGTWSPAIDNTTTTTYTFTPTAGACANPATMTITVNPNLAPTFDPIAAICSGGTFTLPTASTNSPAITGTWSPAIDNTTTTTYTFNPTAGQCATTETMTVTVNPNITPTFTQVAPICAGGTFTLPTSSTNSPAITGTWTPAINNTATTTYTFNPTAGQCSATETMTVTVNTSVPPTITAVPTTCSSAAAITLVANPAGGTFSGPGVSGGTFDPATAGAGSQTITYNIPAVGACPAASATTVIVVTALPTATIAYAGPYCSTSTSEAVTHTGTTGGTYSSTAGLTVNATTGVINPSTSTAGTYTVTYTIPAASGCPAVTATASVTITTIPVPTITPLATLCSNGAAVPVTVAPAGGTLSGTGVTGTTFDPTTAGAGTFTLTYTIAAAAGCPAQTATTVATVPELPTATISYATPFCNTSTSEAVTQTGTNGGAYSSTAGLTINPTTGLINPSTSTAGTYTVTYTIPAASGCPAVTVTTVVDVNSISSATINYAGSPYCTSLTAPQNVTLTGNGGGTYTAAPAGLTIDASSGAVIPSTSTPGTYTVTYTIPAVSTCPAVVVTTTITINELPTATIAYAGPYCSTSTSEAVTHTGTTGGTYSSATGLTINSTTGEINPSTSTAGTYTVTYTIPAASGCPAVTATASVTITTIPVPTITPLATLCSNGAAVPVTVAPAGGTLSGTGVTGTSFDPAVVGAGTFTLTYTIAAAAGCPAQTATTVATVTDLPTATISYATPFCNTSTSEAVTQTGTTGGTYSSTAGLTISPTTGLINPSTSTAGTYTVTYTIPAASGCPAVTVTTVVDVNSVATATINYAGSPYCTSLTTPQSVTLTGNGGGTYTAAPAGLTIDASTGAVIPSTSTPGTYTVTYTIPAISTCPAVVVTTTITINELPTATIAYAGPYCSTSTSEAVTFTGTTGGTYSSTVGLTVNATTGEINPSTSTPGTYTVTYTVPAASGCPAVTATASVTITAIPVPTITPLITLCSNGAAVPVTVAPAGGTLSGTGVTGTSFDPTAAGAGTYTLTYTIAAAAGCPVQTATTVATVTELPTATISYATPFCNTSTSEAVTQTGTTGGTYSSTAGLTVNATTGAINPSTSTAGTYTVTYTIPAASGCPAVTATASVTITAIPVPTITPLATLCSNGAAVPVTVAPAGGTLSGTGVTGTSLNPTTAGAGTYTLTYTIAAAAGCPAQTATTVATVTELPTATISYATPFCNTSTSEAVTQTGTSGGTYSSTAGLTINPTTGLINPSTSTAGNYTVTYTIPAASGCPAVTATTVVDVNSIATATINYAGSPYCMDVTSAQAVTFTGSTGGTYTATPAGLTLDATSGAVVPSTSTAGTYTVSYTIPAIASCAAVTATATVVVNPLPVVSITPIASLCIDATSVAVTVSPTGGTLSGPGITGTNFNPTTAGAGTHTLTYNYTDGNGCSASTTSTVTVSPLPTPSITAISALCANSAAVAIAATPTGGTFSGPGVAGTNFDPSVAGAGTHTITYNVTDGNSCSASTTTTVTVNPVPTATIAGTTDVCQNGTAPVVTFTGAGGTAPYTFTYSLNGAANMTIVSTGNTATISVPTGTPLTNTYTLISVQDASSTTCSNLQAGTVTVKVNALPLATILGTTAICQNGTQPTVTFEGSLGVAPYTFTYNVNGGANQTIVSVGNTATIPAPTSGAGIFTYNLVSVQDASTTTCSNPQTQSIVVTVKPLPVVTATPGLQTLCSGNSTSISMTSLPVNATYDWTVVSNGISGALPGNGNTIAQTLTATGTAIGSATYTITPSLGGCVGLPTDVITTVNPLPTVIATPASQAICSEATTSIALTSAPAGSVFTWVATANNVTGSSNGTGTNIAQTLTSTAGGTVTYAITPTLNGCVGPVTNVVITVNPKPTLVANPTLPTICAGSSVTLNVTGANTYSWSPAVGLNSTTGNSVAASPMSTQAYVITGTDVNGCINTTNVNVTVNPMPVTTVSQSGAICFGASMPLTANGANSYTWSPATGLSSTTGNTVTANPTATTTYTVTGTSLNCSTTATVTVTVNPLPIVNAGLDKSICGGDMITLAGTGAVTYVWNNGVTDNVPFSPVATNTYTVTGISAEGCMDTDEVTISVVDRAVVLATSSESVGCTPLKVEFDNASTGAVTYEWDFGDGTTSTLANPSHTYTTTGCFDVTLTAYTSEGCVTTKVFQEMICTYLTPVASFIANPAVITTASPLSNMINTSLNATDYTWDFGDDSGLSTVKNPAHTFPDDEVTNYVITLVATNESGCTDTARVTIEMIEDIVYYVPNVFTPDGDNFNQTFQPVFTSGFDPFDYSLYIYNRWGELVFESHDALQGWDGTYLSGNGEVVQEGAYVWVIQFKVKQNDKHVKINGHVTLMR